MTVRKKQIAPSHLRPATRAWFSAVLEEFALEPHHVRMLTLAAEAWDRCQEAREAIAAEGLYYKDRFGAPRAHPATRVEVDSRIAFCRTMRELDLDTEPPRETRTPGLGRFN